MDKKKLKRAGIMLGALLLLAIPAKVFFIFYPQVMSKLPPCPSKFLFGILCPGCGTTRALYCLSSGNIAGIFTNNALMPFALLLAAVLYIFPEFSRHYRLINIFTVTVVIFMILRNLPWYPFTLLAPAGI